MITIEGSNLGIRAEDVKDNIKIGGIPCELVSYEISVKIECRTGPAGYEMSASIKVGNEAGFTESSVKFQYKDIRLDGLLPGRGPQSGGTKVSEVKTVIPDRYILVEFKLTFNNQMKNSKNCRYLS